MKREKATLQNLLLMLIEADGTSAAGAEASEDTKARADSGSVRETAVRRAIWCEEPSPRAQGMPSRERRVFPKGRVLRAHPSIDRLSSCKAKGDADGFVIEVNKMFRDIALAGCHGAIAVGRRRTNCKSGSDAWSCRDATNSG